MMSYVPTVKEASEAPPGTWWHVASETPWRATSGGHGYVTPYPGWIDLSLFGGAQPGDMGQAHLTIDQAVELARELRSAAQQAHEALKAAPTCTTCKLPCTRLGARFDHASRKWRPDAKPRCGNPSCGGA
jgi:hypothetical protein